MRFLVFIGSVIGAIFLLTAFFVDSSHQQAALAAMACASVLIPYVLFRLHSIAVEHDQLDQILQLVRKSGSQGEGLAQGEDGAPEASGPVAPRSWMS
ncbi:MULTISPECIES: hypothetical protein [Delftia]|uniref:hypothetical protein n=1 Tax=Delftia TaxID=80865 RepID=UPI0018EA5E93|nr:MULTISPECIES: hypothetical protein [Delftia]MCG3783261.1 hypothetical protein [Delftia acidovorans]